MRALPAIIVLCAAFLAGWAAFSDSPTFDEPTHVVSGLSHLEEGDYRLSRDQPPLGRMLIASPLLLFSLKSPFIESSAASAWRSGDFVALGRIAFCELNSPDLINLGRFVTIAMFLATLLLIFRTSGAIFGSRGALISLTLAAFSPTMLAHGHLATLDMSAALVLLLTLLSFARFFAAPTLTNAAWSGLALGANMLVKFSGPLVLPVVLLMWIVSARDRLRSMTLAFFVSGLIAILCVWGVFGFRYSAFSETSINADSPPTMLGFWDKAERFDKTQAGAWDDVLTDWDGKPYHGAVHQVIRFSKQHQLLPEAYLFGVAAFLKSAAFRSSYLLGEYSVKGNPWYFPVAFLMKSSIPEVLLLILGAVIAVASFRKDRRALVLIVGFFVYLVIFCGNAIVSNLNIGQRHLLSIYPILFILAGSIAKLEVKQVERIIVNLLLTWQIAGTLLSSPDYLGYFNEAFGGSKNGIELLADSNLDWGQDLQRLNQYARKHPDEKIALAYFGSIPPQCINPAWREIFKENDWASASPLTAGTYAISTNQLIGLYNNALRESFWGKQSTIAGYKKAIAEKSPELEYYRRARMISRLRIKEPDVRVGSSMFLYRLSEMDLARLAMP